MEECKEKVADCRGCSNKWLCGGEKERGEVGGEGLKGGLFVGVCVRLQYGNK